MHLLRVSPDNSILDAIHDKEYIGDRNGSSLYAIVDDEGVQGFTAHVFDFILESTNIFVAASGSGSRVQAFGWVDNI